MQSRLIRFTGPLCLLLAALFAGSILLAQPGAVIASDVLVYPVPMPTTDSAIPFAAPDAGAVRTPSAPGAWGEPRSGAEATLSDRVANYSIEATLDPVKHTVTGRQKLAWRNRSGAEVRSVYLHLYMNAFESGASTYFTELREAGHAVDVSDGEWGHIALRNVAQGGAKVPWSFVHPDGGPETDHTVVRLDLPVPVAGGAWTTIDIDFLTQLPRVVARTGYVNTFHLVAQWFPKMGVLELPGERGATAPRWNVHAFHADSEFYADFGHYDVKLTVPTGYTVGATGERQGAPRTVGALTTHHFVQGDVHDFAWTADVRTAAPLTGTWSQDGSPPVAITVLYPPDMAASAAPTLAAARAALSYFARTLGPYPYRTVTVVIPPHDAGFAGAMEYPTFFTTYGWEQYVPDTAAAYELDMLTFHEFGHGYFFGILASNEFEEPMLDEGLNEYWTNRLAHQRGQPARLHWNGYVPAFVNPGFAPFDQMRMETPREQPSDPLGHNAHQRRLGIGPIYTRTATMLRDLEQQLGQATMERAFKEYYRRWKFRHPGIADFQAVLAEVSGQRALVDTVFAQQVYAATAIDDRIDTFTSTEQLPQPGTALVNGKRVQESGDALERRIAAARARWTTAHPNRPKGAGPFPYRTTVVVQRRGGAVPQTVLVRFADGSSAQAAWNPADSAHGAWQKFSWDRPAKAVSVELDPQRAHYLDVSKLDDSRTLDAHGNASRRWAGDVAALINLLLALIASV